MMENPFDIISCSWPRAVEVSERSWVSEPEWDAPLMPFVPQPRWQRMGGEQCWTIQWREFFSSDLQLWNRRATGEMRGFHGIFKVRVNGSGKLNFWDDDGSFIRRNGEVIHADRTAHFWEQGFLACRFGNEKSLALPNQRYLFPVFDGLPGGVMRYDYARNPCGFGSVHFGGLHSKPTDATALVLAPDILGKV